MRTYRIAALLFLLLAMPQAGRADPPVVTAGQLARTVDGALASAARSAQGLDPRNPRYTQFWDSLQAMRTRVSRIEDALGQPGDDFFLLVDQGSSDLGALRVSWARTEVKRDQVTAQIRIASIAYRDLRSRFGREGLRLKQGGALTEAERQQLARLQASQRRFAASLRRLCDEARRRDAATAAELERFRLEAERIAQASADLASYLSALNAASEVRGEWQANRPYVRKTAPPAELAKTDQTVQDLYVDADIGQVFTADLGNADDSSSAASAKVEILQPGEVQEAVVEPILSSDDEEDAEPAADTAMVSETAPEPEETEAPAPEEPPKAPEAAKAEEHPEAAAAPAAPIPPPIG
jgi:hypothetical protein